MGERQRIVKEALRIGDAKLGVKGAHHGEGGVADLQLPDLESCELDSPASADAGQDAEQPQQAGSDASPAKADGGRTPDGPGSEGAA